MREVIKYNTNNFKLVNSDNLHDIDFSQVNNIQFKSFVIYGGTLKNTFTDYDNFCVINNNAIFINEDRYKEDSDIIDNIINKVISLTKEKEVNIDNIEFINDRLIKTICENNNINRVSLSDDYTLTKEHYEMFKASNIEVDTINVCKELDNNFDPIILYNQKKYLIGKETYPRLLHGTFIEIKDDITDCELENFKYINEYCELIISNDNINDYKKILNRLDVLDLNIPVCFEINEKNKDEVYKYILNNNINGDNLFVNVNNDDKVKLSEFLKYEKLLYEMIRGASNLSPFEKYIYAYNITKQFKIYKESEYNKQDSRRLYRLLNNDYMVCVGYSKMFGDLLNKLGINSTGLSTNVDESYKGVKNNEENFFEIKPVKFEGHARRYIYLVDEKYGIDGYYVSDPTFDNDLEKDYYNHMIMTNDEVSYAKSYIRLGNDDIFNVSSIEEYIMKMKIIMKRGYDTNFQEQIKFILETIRELDNDYYVILCNKYPYVKDLSNNFDIPDNVTSLVYDLGHYIVLKVNKTISGKTIFDGIREVYKNSYGYKEEDLDNVLDNVRYYNEERQAKVFPIRYKINEDGSKEIIMNEHNKFDFSLNSVRKI